jgi:hypothetical protein
MKKICLIILVVISTLGCNPYHSEIKSLVKDVMDHPDGLTSILKQNTRSRKFHDWLVENVVIAGEVDYIRSFAQGYTINVYRVGNAFLQPGNQATVVNVLRLDEARQLEFYFSMPDKGGELLGWEPLIFHE